MDLELILYSQNDCDTCSELKEKLVDNKIYFEERNIHDTSQDNMLTKGKFLWEHKDLVSDLNLPPWVPKIIIKKVDEKTGNNLTEYVCVSDRNEVRGNVSIFETPDDGVKRVKEIINQN
tara:strand:- start:2464 stop:2820 length:357 start_codon:yes stop_codon:yes gene_type:complete